MATTNDNIVDLEPVTSSDGETIWAPIEPTCNTPEVVVSRGGTIAVHGSTPELSTLPRDRMSAEGHWDRIVASMQAAGEGRTPAQEVVVQPGGTLVPVHRGTEGRELSKLPEDRMAARASRNDLAEARRLDPGNSEDWTFVQDPIIPGFRFRMRPVARTFTFFTFRSPSHRGWWFLSPLDPCLDDLIGHDTHMIRLSIGGEKVPVVCRNDTTSAHQTLREIRGTAAKFALYHDLSRSGARPFSA